MSSLSRILRHKRASISIMTCLLAAPVALLTGSAVDIARLTSARAILQDATDRAALAGAAVYTNDSSTTRTAAVTTATANFNHATFPPLITASLQTVAAAQGTTNRPGLSYNLTVTASATVKTTFMAMFVPSVSITTTSRGSNPVVTFTIGSFAFGSPYAIDWDSVYAYAVPTDASGNPDFTQVPSPSQIIQNGYEIASNCYNNPGDWCTGQPGASVNDNGNGNSFQVMSTTVIGFALRNVTGSRSNNGYTNQYGSSAGQENWFYSSFIGAGLTPAQNTNETGVAMGNAPTQYPTDRNCSLLMQVLPAGTAIPTSPPASGTCYAPNDPVIGYSIPQLNCSQMRGTTYMFWWNDMGGVDDDDDYMDAYYTISCDSSSGTTSGALLTQ